jgi:hypothetical protein
MLKNLKFGLSRCCLAGFAVVLGAGASTHAAIITDSSFFSSIPHTRITFETDGAGNPINLIQGQSLVMPLTAYANLGVEFVSPVRWVNDGNIAFDAAQQIGGSLPNAIPSSFVNTFDFEFTVPVRSMGMFIANNRAATAPTMTLYDAQNSIIASLTFGGVFIDGTITVPNTTADYGFMGFEADRDIVRVAVSKQHAILDDLYFSPVPAPGMLPLAAIGSLVFLRRRH